MSLISFMRISVPEGGGPLLIVNACHIELMEPCDKGENTIIQLASGKRYRISGSTRKLAEAVARAIQQPQNERSLFEAVFGK